MKGFGDAIKSGLDRIGIHQWSGCPCPSIQRFLNNLTPGYRAHRAAKPVQMNPTRSLITFPDGPVRSGRRGDKRFSYPGKPVGAWYPFSSYPISGGSPVLSAADATQASIQAVHDASTTLDGDTILVPAESRTWTSTLTLTKKVTLMGAGTGTVITDSRPESGSERWVIRHFSLGSTGLFRLTGFVFNGDGSQTLLSDGFIQLAGCSISNASYRIDNNRFNLLRNNVLRTLGAVHGLVDHNDAVLQPAHHLMNANYETWPRDGLTCTGTWADGSWAFPITPGTAAAQYIEYNTVSCNSPNSSTGIVDSNSGGRTVVRKNVLTDVFIGSHGSDSGGRFRGSRWLEAYANEITFTSDTDAMAWCRGGSGVFYGNNVTLTSGGLNWLVKHANLRDTVATGAVWNVLCDGTAPWDGNQSGQTGYRCLDQPGAGTAGTDYADQTTPPSVPANNALEPIYVWNNTVNGAANNCGTQGFGCNSDGHVVVDRDIFYGISRPGYVPFTDPHPLASGITPPPPPPPPGPVVPPSPPPTPNVATKRFVRGSTPI